MTASIDSANSGPSAQSAAISRLFEVNRRVYAADRVVRSYRKTTLAPAEVSALLKYQPDVAGKAVLDMGVGTGRTTHYLAPIAAHYTAMDYSPAMIAAFRRAFPALAVQRCDMRDLSIFADASFHTVFAFSNLISAVNHADRLKVLAEVRRSLRPGGLLVFSAHNLDYRQAGGSPRMHLSRDPVQLARNTACYVRSLANYHALKKLRAVAPEYSILNDEGHDFRLLHYYVSRGVQQRQLSDNGFELLDVFDNRGRALGPADSSAHTPSLLYVARQSNINGQLSIASK